MMQLNYGPKFLFFLINHVPELIVGFNDSQ